VLRAVDFINGLLQRSLDEPTSIVGAYSFLIWDCLCCAKVPNNLTNYSVTSETRVED